MYAKCATYFISQKHRERIITIHEHLQVDSQSVEHFAISLPNAPEVQ